mmetsp:Transcript_21678/g.74482  ORF Transcript_21678/g.74482 Transcript_21678/m.74482 type:complete len:337 (+) Transcript_21678:1-1011(+)
MPWATGVRKLGAVRALAAPSRAAARRLDLAALLLVPPLLLVLSLLWPLSSFGFARVAGRAGAEPGSPASAGLKAAGAGALMDDFEALVLAAPSGAGALAALCEGGASAPAYVVAAARPGEGEGGEVVFLASPPISPGHVVVPGSFNPMHEGHEALGARAVEVRAERGDSPVAGLLFELCVSNADKGAQPLEELRRRAEAVARRGQRLLITRASLYRDKAALCRGCDFVVGYDTYRRIVNPKYYMPPGKALDDASDAERREWVLAALEELREKGIRLLVAGRVEDDGSFSDLEQAPLFELPENMAGMILPIPGFRLDISSSSLRAAAAANAVGASAT